MFRRQYCRGCGRPQFARDEQALAWQVWLIGVFFYGVWLLMRWWSLLTVWGLCMCFTLWYSARGLRTNYCYRSFEDGQYCNESEEHLSEEEHRKYVEDLMAVRRRHPVWVKAKQESEAHRRQIKEKRERSSRVTRLTKQNCYRSVENESDAKS